MITIWRAFAGITSALILAMTALAPPAQSAPASHREPSVCANGFRGQPAYDRLCLTRGTPEDAAVMWFTTYRTGERRAQCRTAWRNGDMIAVVTETRGDMIGDAYRNDRQMTRLTARMGVADCVSMGFTR